MAAPAASSSLRFQDDLLALWTGEMMLVAMSPTSMTALDLVGLKVFLVALLNLVARLRVVAGRDHHHRNHHHHRSYAGAKEVRSRREVPLVACGSVDRILDVNTV